MTEEERKILRRHIGNAVMIEQNIRCSAGMPIDVVLPEILAALLSLAAYVSANNANLSRDMFLNACEMAAQEVYK